MYFAMSQDDRPTIEKAALDGTKRSTFISQIGQVGGLAIDYRESYIYWSDIASSLIERAKLENPMSSRETILPNNMGYHPIAVAHYEVRFKF